VFVLDVDTAECLHYEAVAGVPPKKSLRIPREAFAKHRDVDVRNDLIDCGIDICSVEVQRPVRSPFVFYWSDGLYRYRRCSRTTLTIWTFGGILCTGF